MTPRPPRIRIEDLPPLELLSEEERAAIFGTGLPRARLNVEGLETRDLMAAAVTATLTDGLLRVEGTPGADTIRLIREGDQIRVDGVNIIALGQSKATVPAAQVQRIAVAGDSGNDTVRLTYPASAVLPQIDIDGGAGSDRVVGPSGNTVVAESGADTLSGAVFFNGTLVERAADGTLWKRDVWTGAGTQFETAQVEKFQVAGGKVIALTSTGILRVRDLATDQITVNKGTSVTTGVATGFGVVGGRVIISFADGYLRQINFDGTGWDYANRENGTYTRVARADFVDGYVVYREDDGSLRVRNLVTDQVTLSKEDVRWHAVTGPNAVLAAFGSGNVNEYGLSGTVNPRTFTTPAAIADQLWQLGWADRVAALDALAAERRTDVLAAKTIRQLERVGEYAVYSETGGSLRAVRLATGEQTLSREGVRWYTVTPAGTVLTATAAGNMAEYGLSGTTNPRSFTTPEAIGARLWELGWADRIAALDAFTADRQSEILTTRTIRRLEVVGGYAVYAETGGSLRAVRLRDGVETLSREGIRWYKVTGPNAVLVVNAAENAVEYGLSGTVDPKTFATPEAIGARLWELNFADRVAALDALPNDRRSDVLATQGISELNVVGGYAVYFKPGGSLRVRRLDNEALTLEKEDVRWYKVTGPNAVLVAFGSGNLHEYSLSGTVSPNSFITPDAIGTRLWELGLADRVAALDAFVTPRRTDILMSQGIRELEVVGGYAVYLKTGGSLRVRRLDNENLTLEREDVRWYMVTGPNAVLTATAQGNVAEYSLSGTIDPKSFTTPDAIGDRLWQLDWIDRLDALDAFTSDRTGEILWTRSDTGFREALSYLSVAQASDILRTYVASGVGMVDAAFDRMSATRAAQIRATDLWRGAASALDRLTGGDWSDAADFIASFRVSGGAVVVEFNSVGRKWDELGGRNGTLGAYRHRTEDLGDAGVVYHFTNGAIRLANGSATVEQPAGNVPVPPPAPVAPVPSQPAKPAGTLVLGGGSEPVTLLPASDTPMVLGEVDGSSPLPAPNTVALEGVSLAGIVVTTSDGWKQVQGETVDLEEYVTLGALIAQAVPTGNWLPVVDYLVNYVETLLAKFAEDTGKSIGMQQLMHILNGEPVDTQWAFRFRVEEGDQRAIEGGLGQAVDGVGGLFGNDSLNEIPTYTPILEWRAIE